MGPEDTGGSLLFFSSEGDKVSVTRLIRAENLLNARSCSYSSGNLSRKVEPHVLQMSISIMPGAPPLWLVQRRHKSDRTE